jgi:RHS repeat-associated protein
VTLPDGQPVSFGYDSAGRLSAINLPTGQLGYGYDTATVNLSSMTAPGGVDMGYAYDGSLPTGTTWTGSVAGSVTRTYDSNFRTASLKVGGGAPVAFGYDADGLLTSADGLTLSYDAHSGLLTGTTLGGVTDAVTYNTFGEPVGYTATQGGMTLYSVLFTRDALGRITRKVETIGGATDTYDYTYDVDGRLTQVQKDGVVASAYTYDANGNRLSATGPGGTVTGTYDDQDRLLTYGGTTYTYTASGTLLSRTESGQTTTYQYDLLGNLVHVGLPDGTEIDYLVDGEGRRVGKKVNGVLVQGFLYQDGLRPAAELDAHGNVVSTFIYASDGNTPSFMLKGGVTYRIISDQVGSPRLVVNAATGEVVQRLDYDAFGNVLLDTNPGFQPFGFAGGLYDRDTGLMHFGARDYDARTGRWTAQDPVRFAGKDTNLYGYTRNDPVNFQDPTGLAPSPCSPSSRVGRLIRIIGFVFGVKQGPRSDEEKPDVAKPAKPVITVPEKPKKSGDEEDAKDQKSSLPDLGTVPFLVNFLVGEIVGGSHPDFGFPAFPLPSTVIGAGGAIGAPPTPVPIFVP